MLLVIWLVVKTVETDEITKDWIHVSPGVFLEFFPPTFLGDRFWKVQMWKNGVTISKEVILNK